MKGGIFAWIRAVARAELPPGCKGFCLELIPLLDTKTCSSSRSIASTAERVSASSRSIKRFRRLLSDRGLIERGEGWILCLEGGVTSVTPVSSVSPEHVSRCHPCHHGGVTSVTEVVSPVSPALYNGTSASPSTSPSTNDQCWEKEEVKTRELSSLHTSHRPDVNGRSPTHPVRHQAWLDQWSASKGKEWPWPGWTEAVLPYLTEPEREELLGSALSTDNPNLNYFTAIVNGICSGIPREERLKRSSKSSARFKSPAPVVLDHTTDSLWKGVFS